MKLLNELLAVPLQYNLNHAGRSSFQQTDPVVVTATLCSRTGEAVPNGVGAC